MEPKSAARQTSHPVASTARDGAHQALLQCLADDVHADAVWLLVREGSRRSPQVVSSLNPGGLAEPERWLGGEFLTRLLESQAPILEPGDGGMVAEFPVPPSDRVGVERGLGAVVPSPAGVEAILCAGFASLPDLGRDRLLWAVGSFAVVAALCVNDSGGFIEALSCSRRDPLTGCLSYGGLLDALEKEINRSARRHYRLACCFLDVDDFKRINGTIGHLKGNKVLAEIGATLRSGVRTYDLVGRFGGDEFVVILPETDVWSARKLAGRLRSRVGKAASRATSAPVQVSIGIAEWADGMSAEELLESADGSLRGAKDAQGAGVVSASPHDAIESVHEVFEDVAELIGGDGRTQARDRAS